MDDRQTPTVVVTVFDDLFPSTRVLYFRQSQLCLLEIVVKNTCAKCSLATNRASTDLWCTCPSLFAFSVLCFAFAGPALHAHPVASKRPPAPTPGHQMPTRTYLVGFACSVRWAASPRETERRVHHGGRRGTLQSLAPTRSNAHARVPTHNSVTCTCMRPRAQLNPTA